MTSPIKPPGSGGPPSIAPRDEAKGASKSGEAKGPKESFKATMDNVAGAKAPEGVGRAASVGGVQEIAAALKAGKIDAAGAVEKLVARALESPAAQALNEVGRAQLEAQIRDAIETDPALQSLVSDLDAG